ncbi:MAG: class I SAM-dependent methyltransferase [Planctomycetaceae bacterium]|nr:class I SAM-dependent methyltransferase [Planctomycetaceae bacterium]
MQIETNSPNHPDFLFEDLPLEWLMTRWEKYALQSLLMYLKPKISLEIGTFRGGSLQMLSRFSSHVVSVDILDEPRQKLSGLFKNVEFRVGDSTVLVPRLISELQTLPDALGFVLIDGDHTTEGVRRDIENVLRYRPKETLYIIMHDSFHPPCRAGMLSAKWADCPFVHYVEVDFVPGVYFQNGFGTIQAGSMYGGFALAKLEPVERRHDLEIGQVQLGLYQSTLANAASVLKKTEKPPQSGLAEILTRLRRVLRPRARLKSFLSKVK